MREGYWLVYDDSPIEVTRIKGWDGANTNPYCFNCEHPFLDHRQVAASDSFHGMKEGYNTTCRHLGCKCNRYEPSYTAPLDADADEQNRVIGRRISEQMNVQIHQQPGVTQDGAAWFQHVQEIADGVVRIHHA